MAMAARLMLSGGSSRSALRHAPLGRAGRLTAAAAGALSVLALGAARAETPLQAAFAERWVARDEALVLRIGSEGQSRWRQWRWFVGTREVTALARLAAPGVLELVPVPAPWATGEAELVVREGDGAGTEVARWPLRVRNAAGFEKTETTRRQLDLGSEGRGTDRRSDGRPTSPRTGQADATAGLGGGWKGQREDWALEAAANLAGHSQRERALRYGQLNSEAPKLDLADYRLALGWREQMLEVGHLSAGTNPLLASSFASRGIGLRGQLAPGADVALHALRGTAVVGWSDPSGLVDEEHRQYVLTIGAELIASRPGALRAEVSALDASVRSQTPFNGGVVPDAERTLGAGLRLLGSTEGGRASGELVFARTRHTHPLDPALAPPDGSAIVAVRTATSDAWLATLRFVLLRAQPEQPLDLSLDLRHERAAPQYRSSAASVTPDQEASRLGLQAGLHGATAQLSATSRVDNLERIVTLLRTRTEEGEAGLSLPLGTWLRGNETVTSAAGKSAAGAEVGAPGSEELPGSASAVSAAGAAGADGAAPSQPLVLWPTLSINAKRVHQRAVNEPRVEDSGIAASHRPDQLTEEQQLKLDWAFGANPLGIQALGYGVSRSRTDNRQPGREGADFDRLAHQASLSLSLGEAWRLALAVQHARQLSIETGIASRTIGGSLQADWRASERLAISAQLRHDLADDSLDVARQASDGAQLQFNWRFDVAGVDKKLPGQFFVRLGYEAQRQRDATFGTAAAFRAAWVDLGLSFSFY
jgi:hypothetical protein